MEEFASLQLPYRPAGGFPEEQEDLGEIIRANLICPGVYYIETDKSKKYEYGAEWALVLPDSPAVPPKARAYGSPLPSCPDLVLFPYKTGNGWPILQYEIHKYQTENGIRQPAELLRTELSEGMRYYPEYFGEFPAPTSTPWGPPLRSKAIANGVFWVETAEMKLGMAVCYSIAADFHETMLSFAVLTDLDQQIGIQNTCGYYFYPSNLLQMPFVALAANIPEYWPKIQSYLPAILNTIHESSSTSAGKSNFRKIDCPDPFDDLSGDGRSSFKGTLFEGENIFVGYPAPFSE